MRIIRRVTLCATATALVVTAIGAAPAQAAPTPLSVDSAATFAETLSADSTAGTYLDSATGRLVINVTDAATAKSARAAGAQVRVVKHSAASLNGLISRIDKAVPGTAFSIDPMTNQVVVDVDPTVAGAKLAALEAGVAAAGDAARIQRQSTKLTSYISGGDAIYGGGSRCSLGFNARNSSGVYFFVTAGHCTRISSTWTNGSATLGTRQTSSFPGNDYGAVRYTNNTIVKSGTVGSVEITGSGNAQVNQNVSRRGSTTGTHSGRVTALGATVNYAEGTVTGMIRTTVCAQPGDSGGSLYAGSTALGLTSGGSGNCSSGGTTFFNPVGEALNSVGAAVY